MAFYYNYKKIAWFSGPNMKTKPLARDDVGGNEGFLSNCGKYYFDLLVGIIYS